MSQKDDTGFPAYSDSAGTAKKCHCKRGASYCVTVSKKKLLYEGPIGSSQKCHCKRGASYSVASLTSISTSTDPRTMDEAHQQDFQPIASQLQLVVYLILHITTSVYLFVCSSLARSRIVRLWHARMEWTDGAMQWSLLWKIARKFASICPRERKSRRSLSVCHLVSRTPSFKVHLQALTWEP